MRFTPFLEGETVKRETEMAAQQTRGASKARAAGIGIASKRLGKSSHVQLHFPVEIS
jgi:hypothetical protein